MGRTLDFHLEILVKSLRYAEKTGMRLAVFAPILMAAFLAFGLDANANPPAPKSPGLIARARAKIECEGERVIRDMANIASDLNQGFNSALGFSDKCWTDSSGASTISCEEVMRADREGFVSHYDYAPDPMGISRNHRHCVVPKVASILEDLMVSDLAKEVEDSLGCQLPFLNDLVDKPTTKQIQDFQDKAFSQYEKVLPELKKLIPERDRLQHAADFGSGVCRGPAKEGYDPQMTPECKAYRSEAGRAGEARAKELTSKIELLINSIPMAVDPNVHSAVLKLATSGVATKPGFLGGYRKPFKQIRDDSLGMKQQLQKARLNDGDQYFIEPLLRAQLLGIPNYKEFVNSKTKLSPKIRNTLTCLQDARKTGATRATIINFSVAAASAALTMGASAGVIALGEGATAGLIALDLGVATLGNIQTVDAIYSSCYGNLESFTPGQQCTPEQGMNVVMGRSSRAECAANVAPVVAPTVIAGMSLAGKAVLRTTTRELGAVASEASTASRVADVVDDGPPIEVVARRSDRRSSVRPPNRSGVEDSRGLAERLSPSRAQSRKRQDLIDAIERKTFSTTKENADYIEAALEIKPENGALFFYEENGALKAMNEMYKDQNFVTALTNLRLHFLNQRLKSAGFHMPDQKALKNGDYKSLAAAWRDGLTPEQLERVKRARELARQDYIEELERLKIVRSEDDVAGKFRAATGDTADKAAFAARAARALPDTGVRDYNDPEIVAIMESNLKQAHDSRRAVAERPAVRFLLETTADGHLVPTRDAFVLMRKNAEPEQLLAAIKQRYPQSTLTLDDARDLASVNKAVDNFNPQLLNETRKVASLKEARYGGASGDFCGMGAANNHATACAIASAPNRDAAIVAARSGERQITAEFKRKFARWKQIMGSADCSGDDCVSMANGRPWTRQEKQDRLNRLNNDPLTRDMRVGFASEKVANPNDIDKITYHAESIEQKMRARLAKSGFSFERSKDITFAVDMDAAAAGEGTAAWLAGVQGKALSAQERTMIDEAFSGAVQDVNEHLTANGLKGRYRPGK